MSTPQLPFTRQRLCLRVALVLGTLSLGSAGSGLAQTATPAPATPAATAVIPANLAARLTQGNQALAAKDYKKAQTAFEAAVALDYRNFDAHFGLGLALFNLNDLLGASFEFRQLVGLAPDRIEGYYNLGVVQARAGDRTGAIASLKKAAEVGKGKVLNPVQISTLRVLAAQQAASGAYGDAAVSLREALDLEPADISLALALAENLYRGAQGTATPAAGAAPAAGVASAATPETALSDALTYAYRVLTVDPGNLRATTLVADIYVEQKLIPRALAELDRSALTNPRELEKSQILFKKAQVLQAQNRKQEAAATLAQVTSLDPSNGVALYQLGRILLEGRQIDRALEALGKAAQQNPQSPEITLGLAFAYDAKTTALVAAKQDAQSARQEAYRYAIAATKLTSEAGLIASANLIAAKAAYGSKQYAIARRLLSGASTPEALNWLGLSNYALRDYAGAIAALEGAAKVLTNNPAVQANLGASYLAAKRYSDAQVTLDALVKRSPRYAEAWYNLGWALRNLSRDTEARAAFKQAANLGYTAAVKEVQAP